MRESIPTLANWPHPPQICIALKTNTQTDTIPTLAICMSSKILSSENLQCNARKYGNAPFKITSIPDPGPNTKEFWPWSTNPKSALHCDKFVNGSHVNYWVGVFIFQWYRLGITEDQGLQKIIVLPCVSNLSICSCLLNWVHLTEDTTHLCWPCLFVCLQKLQSKCRRPTKGGLLADSSLTFGDVCEGCSWPAYSCVSPPPFPGTNPDLTSSSSFLTGRASYVSLMPGCQIMTQTGWIRKMSSCTFLERRIRVQVFAGGFLLLLLLSPNPSFLSHQLDFPSADQSIWFSLIRKNSPGPISPESCEGDLGVSPTQETQLRQDSEPAVEHRCLLEKPCSSRSASRSTSTSSPSSSCSTRWSARRRRCKLAADISSWQQPSENFPGNISCKIM